MGGRGGVGLSSALHQEHVAAVEDLRADVDKHLGVLAAERMHRRITELRALADDWQAALDGVVELLEKQNDLGEEAAA